MPKNKKLNHRPESKLADPAGFDSNLKKILILDANAIVHRFYHALPTLTTPTAEPIQAVYGLANVLLRALKEIKPDMVFACFDTAAPTFRHKLTETYKSTRPKTADDLKSQLNLAKDLLRAFRIQIFERSGYEADDLIGTLVKHFPSANKIILTGDLDTLQLVDDRTRVYIFKKGLSQIDIYDQAEVKKRFNLAPAQLVDYKSLVGDASDNIIGLKGVGPKTAGGWLGRFGSIDQLIEKAAEIKNEKLSREILENKDQIFLNQRLARIETDIDLGPVGTKDYQLPDFSQIRPILEKFGFKSMIKRISNQVNIEGDLDQNNFNSSSVKSGLFDRLTEAAGGNSIVIVPLRSGFGYFDGQFHQVEKSVELLKKLFLAEGEKIVFDLKEILKIILAGDVNFNFDPTKLKIFDLRLATWLTEPDSTKLSLAKFVNLKSNAWLNQEIDQVVFLVEHSVELCRLAKAKLSDFGLGQIYDLELKLSLVLAQMEVVGVYLDRTEVEKFKEFLKEKIDRLTEKIQDLVGEKFKLNSTKDLRRILFQKLKIETKGLAKTPKGEVSTQESELDKIKTEHRVVALILAYRELVKIESTYTDSLIRFIDQTDGRLHTNFDQTGTVTGRLSSEKPNLQNLPIQVDLAKQLRQAFRPATGYLFLSLDYSQLELRLAAHLSEDDNLVLAFQQDFDIHSITAKLLFHDDSEKYRRMAKTINFGIIYGISSAGLKKRLGLSLSASQALIDDYFKKFPGVKKMRLDFIEQAKTFGYAETLFGRKRFIPEINTSAYREQLRAERLAINSPIQGLGADLIKKVMVEIHDFLEFNHSFPEQARLILQIHDELILEVKADLVYNLETEFKRIMVEVVKLKVPLKVKTRIGRSLAEL